MIPIKAVACDKVHGLLGIDVLIVDTSKLIFWEKQKKIAYDC